MTLQNGNVFAIGSFFVSQTLVQRKATSRFLSAWSPHVEMLIVECRLFISDDQIANLLWGKCCWRFSPSSLVVFYIPLNWVWTLPTTNVAGLNGQWIVYLHNSTAVDVANSPGSLRNNRRLYKAILNMQIVNASFHLISSP
jgi:hypothetical protein